MTFIQPLLLWGLPLLLLPLAIHFLNRLRYRSVRWAATMFLLLASRSASRSEKLRHLLLLLLRTLAIIFIVLALSRPLAGGFLGHVFRGPPDVAILLLDRSASMEVVVAGTERSGRERAVEQFKRSGMPLAGSTSFVLIENVDRTPTEVTRLSMLEELPQAQATDSSADIPAMLQAAIVHILRSPPGRAEIWIASDMQRSNWRPDSPEWDKIRAELSALPQEPAIRIASINPGKPRNVSVVFDTMRNHAVSDRASIILSATVTADPPSDEPVPLTIEIDGVPQQVMVNPGQGRARIRHVLPVAENRTHGRGQLRLPPDEQMSDNISYFAYDLTPRRHTVVAALNGKVRAILRLAAVPGDNEVRWGTVSDLGTGSELTTDLDEAAMLLWEGPFPAAEAQPGLRRFIESGGVVCMFPDHGDSGVLFDDLRWGNVEQAGRDEVYRIGHWDTQDGPLANTLSGEPLPVDTLRIWLRRLWTGDMEVLARFQDGIPFLGRRLIGRGQLILCATPPDRGWSNLQEGMVLVPMLQRLVGQGTERLGNVRYDVAGVFRANLGEVWKDADDGAKDVNSQAGVYTREDQILVLNRAKEESDTRVLTKDELETAMAGLTWSLFSDSAGVKASEQSELWSMCMIAVLAFLLGESIMTRPAPRRVSHAAAQRPQGTEVGAHG